MRTAARAANASASAMARGVSSTRNAFTGRETKWPTLSFLPRRRRLQHRGRNPRGGPGHREHRHLLLQAFERELAEGFGLEAAHHAIERVLRNDHLAGFGHAALEARRDVDRAAEHRVVDALLRADVADHRRAAVDPDTHLDDRQV